MSDGQLLARFTARRDELAEVAFAALVHRHGPMVLRVCRQVLGDRHTAEDAFQATFLILARKAGSIRQAELLGNWLYGVALRTAREARMRDDRRRRRESTTAEGIGGEPIDEAGRPESTLACREEFEALHEELSRLPARYRIPIVLCGLEGLTYQEAARRLRCPVGTIGVRISRARERLRVRLLRRGLAPSAGLLGALAGAGDASAWVPSALVDTTIRAAAGFAAKEAAATWLISAPVVALTERVLRTMALKRLKTAASLFLVVGLTATVGWLGGHRVPWIPAATVQGRSQPKAEAPLPGNPAATALGNQATLGPAIGARPAAAHASPEALDPSNRKGKEEIAQDRRNEGSEPEAAPAVAAPLIRDEVARGELLFTKEWVPDDPMSHAGDGLGPVYNETSCMACHGLGAPGGGGPEGKNVVLVTATPTGSGQPKGLDQIHPGFRGARSTVLHRFGTDPGYRSWRRRFYDTNRNDGSKPPAKGEDDSAEARIRALKEQIAAERRIRDQSPRSRTAAGYTLTFSERNPPALFGAGRIDAIPSEVLVAQAQREPSGVRGRVGRTREGQVGRFGWKAQIPSLHEFVRAACANELGLEVPGHAQAISPLAYDREAKGLDLTGPDCDAMVAYVRALPAPVVVDPSGPLGGPDIRAGRRLFAKVGCVACHTPTLGGVPGIYSDLLLHNMGQSLSDSGNYYGPEFPDSPGGSSPSEWRTPPLWGYRDSGPYLHDGRAENLEEAIALHEGQGAKSAHLFFALSAQERSQVEAFLKSLVAPSWAATRGVVLAAEMESRLDQEERDAPETLVRQRREEAVARDEQQWLEAQRRRRAQEAARRAIIRFPAAQDLEKMGKLTGALDYYREIARDAPDTVEGRVSAARISALGAESGSP